MSLPQKNFDLVEGAIFQLLRAIGEDPTRDGLKDTPKRVAKMYSEIFDGNFVGLKEKDSTTFQQEKYGGMIMVRNVPFYAFCEHHLMLFHGRVSVGYVPDKKILGLSKLVRLFRHACKKPTIQERVTEEAIDNLVKAVNPKGAICQVDAEHTCMTLRGVKSPGSTTVTTAWRGVFEDNQELRQMFVNLASQR